MYLEWYALFDWQKTYPFHHMTTMFSIETRRHRLVFLFLILTIILEFKQQKSHHLFKFTQSSDGVIVVSAGSGSAAWWHAVIA